MNPGLVVKLRPTGPWRIGPDSGARNRVDVIYHSDSLYSAVTSAMSRMGRLEEWLDATARSATPAVSFSSCFPFVEEIGFVVPPRTVWPPLSTSAMAAQVRWKSARFIPLGMVQSILAGERLDENRWSVDGPSGCLLPTGRPGPFRTAVRWSAAVDRLSGASERHSTACIEFRPGAGLWTVVGFADEAARDQWQDAVKAAFRWLADTGFGGERSRGWGRSEAPEFVEGELPGMITGVAPVEVAAVETGPVEVAVVEPEAASEPVAVEEEAPVEAAAEAAPSESESAPETAAVEEVAAEAAPEVATVVEDVAAEPTAESDAAPAARAEETAVVEPAAAEPVVAEAEVTAPPVVEPLIAEPLIAEPAAVEAVAPVPAESRKSGQAHWMLSLFTPAAEDTVDWGRGSYTLMARGGRVDSPAGSGELKKQVQMIAEGSVLVAATAPRGAASNVAPDGFAHPVFRAGFALAIPLPEGN